MRIPEAYYTAKNAFAEAFLHFISRAAPADR
jgi:hypothetical protein